MKKTIFFILLLVITSVILAEEKREYIVTAPTGLILRTNPDLNSNKVTTIPFGEVIFRNNNFSKSDSKPYYEFYDNKMVYDAEYHGENSWYKIEYLGFEGYAYGFFLVDNNQKNKNFFTYNEEQREIELKRNFINIKHENGNIKKIIYTQILHKSKLIYQLESPLIFNETAFIKENYLYFEKPLLGSELMGYQGYAYPLFYKRFMKLDLNNKKQVFEIMTTIASPATSISNNQIIINFNHKVKTYILIDLPEKQNPNFLINDKKIQVSNEISNAFKCLNTNKYFDQKPNASVHTSSDLINIPFGQNITNFENQIIEINICDKKILLNIAKKAIQ